MRVKTTVLDRGRSRSQQGNATIYVLIVVILFGALTFILSRQSGTGEGGIIGKDRMEILVNQVLSYPYQVKQAVDMMTMSGTKVPDLDFTLPDHADYNDMPVINKVFHPEGGGLLLSALPRDVVGDPGFADPPPGWYLGRFINVEWSLSPDQDVILTAFPIRQDICAAINKKILGYADPPPALGDSIQDILIANEYPPGDTIHSGTNDSDFTASLCADCEGKPSMCVSDGNGRFAFYSIIVSR